MSVNTSFEFSRAAQLLRMTQARHATSQNIANWRPFEKKSQSDSRVTDIASTRIPASPGQGS